ncbi:MAG: glycosyltransferase [Thermoplasmata archaeon]|jgi:glycosyltransferase involved in cell wall biosynthesis
MSTFAGGTTTYNDRLAKELMRQGDRVVLQSDRVSLTEFGRQSYVQPVWTRDPRYVVQNLLAAHRDGGHDVVHIQHEYYLFGGPSTALLFPLLLGFLRLMDRPVVTTLHGVLSRAAVHDSRVLAGASIPAAVAWPLMSSLQRAIVAGSDAVVVHDGYFRDVLVNECGAGPESIHVIPHGVTIDLPHPARPSARADLGLPKGATILLSFGFLARYKGLETLIDAFNKVAPQRPDLLLVVAGGPPARNVLDGDAYRASLEGRVAPPLRGRVRFVGYVPEAAIPSWFAAADLVVLTHAVPLAASGVLALAQGFGSGVVAPSIPPFLGSVTASGTLYEAGSADDLAQVLFALTGGATDLRLVEESSRGDGRRASWSEVARRHHELYESLIRGRR